ncbi:MAG TPA: EAL domain-containing protein [Candidatus Baltobacteraceae bacterium]|nr:EAL domain-containing protein [Candidatus Baltobacteraceae bacterium]
MLGGVLFGAAGAAALLGMRSRREARDVKIFEKSPTPMWFFNVQTLRFLDVNEAAIAHYGYSREEFLAMTILDIRSPEEVPGLLEHLQQNVPSSTPTLYRHRTKSGQTIYVNIRSYDAQYAGGAGRFVYAIDMTSQYETEQRLRESEATLQLAQEVAHLGSYVYDYLTEKTYCSSELCRMLRIEPDGMQRGMLWEFDHPDDADRVRREVEAAKEEGRPYKTDHRVLLRDGTVLHVEERGYWAYGESGEPLRMIGTILDISERKTAEAALAHLAFHDPLTNQLNRAGLRHHLSQAIKERHAAGLTPVFFLDLDRFKTVNDTLGHVVGDQLLVEIGRRIARHLRTDEVLARTGGDEFTIVAPPMPDRTNISLRARQLLEAFSAPFTIAGLEHTVSASLGISVYPLDAQETDALLRNADVAMYAAKARGGATFHYYTADLQRTAEERFRMEAALRRALDKGEFSLRYQPVVCGRSREIVAVEALLRWTDPDIGSIPPSAFIPLAEETGFIRRIGAWVFEHAFAQAKRWSDAGTPIRVWVNVSPEQLHDASLPQTIADLLREHELDGSLIGLELTESSFIDHERDLLATLNQIRSLRVHLALDDFGVKYSSLEYLQRLPITNVKIDRVFVSDIANNPFNASIVRAIVNVAHDVGFRVTAEGVESQGELSVLSAMGCDAWQGFLFSTARPADEIDLLIAAQFAQQPDRRLRI